MNGNSSFQQIINRGFIKQICDKILQGIDKVQNAPDYERRRWIWELMQNAKDVPNRFDGVSIKIELFPDRLIFSHNGVPFTKEQLSALIMQVSSKDDDPEDTETTGKFGTGFITTHMLSRTITVRGVLEVGQGQYKRFSMLLDRSGNTFAEMQPRIDEALVRLCQIEDDAIVPILYDFQQEEDRFDTQFEYPLTESGLEIARNGIRDLDVSLPYAMIFIPKIKAVTIHDHHSGRAYTVTLEKESPLGQDGRTCFLRTFIKEIHHTSEWTNEAPYEKLYIVSYKTEIITLAQRIEDSANVGDFVIGKNGDELPKVFRDFPLVGTGKFYLPVVLNSHLFRPTEPRDGIYLKNPENINVQENRELLESSIQALFAFLELIINEKWGNIHLLALSTLPENNRDYIDLDWYKEMIQRPLRAFLLDQPLVKTKSSDWIPLKTARFPIYKEGKERRKTFFGLVEELKSEVLPVMETYFDWLEIILPQYDVWETKLKYTLDDLMEELQGIGNLEELTNQCFQEKEDAINWLNRLVDFLIAEEEKIAFEKYAVLPNQKGEFKKLDDLRYDEGIPSQFIDALALLGEDWRDQLMDNRITRISNHLTLGVKEISSKINDWIQAFSKGYRPLNAEQERGLFLMVGYLTSEDSNKRKSIWNFARVLFPAQVVGHYTIVQGTSDFSWDPLNRWAIKRIMETLAGYEKIETLLFLFAGKEQETLFFLNTVLSFVAHDADFKDYLDQYRVVPCQHGDFRYLKDLENDPDQVPESLKTILSTLTSGREDWKTDLLHLSIAIDTSRKRTLQDICTRIDGLLIEKRNEGSLSTTYKNPALQVINLIKTDENKYRDYFPRLSAEFAQIQVDLMKEHQEDINRILQHESKIKALAIVAESKMTSEEISHLISTAEEVGVSKVMAAAEVLLEEKRDFEFKRRIGGFAEKAFRDLAEKNDFALKVVQRDGTQDFVLQHPRTGEEYLVEIKSISSSSDYVLLSKRQGQTAVEKSNRYCLCVIRRSVGNLEVDQEYFLSQAKFIPNIGNLMAGQVRNAEYIDQNIEAGGAIEIAFVDRTYKFKVKDSVWENGFTYSSFMDYLARNFLIQ